MYPNVAAVNDHESQVFQVMEGPHDWYLVKQRFAQVHDYEAGLWHERQN